MPRPKYERVSLCYCNECGTVKADWAAIFECKTCGKTTEHTGLAVTNDPNTQHHVNGFLAVTER